MNTTTKQSWDTLDPTRRNAMVGYMGFLIPGTSKISKQGYRVKNSQWAELSQLERTVLKFHGFTR